MDALAIELNMRKVETAELGADRTEAGSVDAGLVAYYRSTDFTDSLSSGTQSMRRQLLERFRNSHGKKRLKLLERKHVQAYISSLKGAAPQRSMLQALKHFLSYCVTTHLISDNVAEGVKRKKLQHSSGHYAWTEEDYAKYCERHPIGTTARLALALYVNLGVCKSDVVRIGPRMVTACLPSFVSRRPTAPRAGRSPFPYGRDQAGDRGDEAEGRRYLSRHLVRQAVHGGRLRQQDA